MEREIEHVERDSGAGDRACRAGDSGTGEFSIHGSIRAVARTSSLKFLMFRTKCL